jgi:hypothetical protein
MHDTYDDYLEESIQLAIVYIQAVYELYLAPREDDYIREAFLKVVVNADLGVPLQRHIPESAKENLPILKKVIKERWALAGARAWLKYVDQIEYAESWDNTSENFKIKNDKNDFVTYLTSMRERFGKLKSRELKCVNYITSCPGYSVGEYVNIEFRTSYENNDCALEKIITILDRNRDWKVLDYKIESNTGGTGP